MSNFHIQKFPTGETRVFEWEEGEQPVITAFTRAKGDTRKESMIGKPESELPERWEPEAAPGEDVESR